MTGPLRFQCDSFDFWGDRTGSRCDQGLPDVPIVLEGLTLCGGTWVKYLRALLRHLDSNRMLDR